ncbi:hypothetical protein K440DRAFT_603277 [Wilcoxina mikolae CBS 423.85]|nr:hypothetical protein K440DRAFT_603277 [Wilcoxina mikolae CBS 423.85]
MGSERVVAAALVDWINACPIDPKIHNLRDIGDGSVIAKVLQDIDPNYFKAPPAENNERSNGWLSKFQKLRKLHRDLTKYYTEILGHRLPDQGPNLTAIAKDGNVEEAIKLAKIVVATAVLSDRKEDYIAMIQGLSPSSQTEMMNILNEMILQDQGEDAASEHEDDVNVRDMNQFRVEEDMARLVRDNEAAEAEIETLKKDLAAAQEKLEEKDSEIMSLQSLIPGSDDNDRAGSLQQRIIHLETTIKDQEDVIAEKESTVSSQERTITGLKRKVEDLQPQAETALKYKDELDEANHNIDRLKKNLNAAEKYRRKLETMSEIELQNKTLEEQNAQMFKELRAGEENAKQVLGLKRTVEQYKKQVARLETEYAEASRVSRELEAEKLMLLSKSDGAEYQKTKDQERIRNLEEKIRELESGVISENAEEYGGDLGSEITFATKTKSDLKLKIARLEAEIRHLKESGGAGADNVVLQHRLQDVERARSKLEEDYLTANTARLVAESQLYAIRSGTASEGSEVMLKLRQNLVDAETELSEIKRQQSETAAELAITKRALVTAQSDLSLVGKDKLEALDELKAAANTDLSELQVAYVDLEKKYKDLETELDIKKSLLNTVLLEKDAVATKLSELKDQMLEKEQDMSEMRATIATFRGSTEGRDAALERHVQKLQEKMEKRRVVLSNSIEHIKKQNTVIKELKEKLDAAIAADTNEKLAMMEERVTDLKVPRPAPSSTNATSISTRSPPQSLIIGNLLTFLAYRAEKEGLRNRAAGTRELAAHYRFS